VESLLEIAEIGIGSFTTLVDNAGVSVQFRSRGVNIAS
jgi:hypothetical protein